MIGQVEPLLAARLGRCVRWVHRRPRQIVWACLCATLVLGLYAGFNLGINSNNLDLLDENLPSRVNHAEFAALFPNLENALLIVIDGHTAQLARDSAEALAARLRQQTERFGDVYLPGGGRFFERHGLLYRSVDELDQFGDRIAIVQPMIAELERDPSIANLAGLVRRGLTAVRDETSGRAAEEWPLVLDHVSRATVTAYAEYPIAISWDAVLMRGSSLGASTRQVVIANPVLEFSNVLAAGRAVDAIRRSAEDLGLIPERGVRVRVTGNPALNLEEMIGIAWDIGAGGVFCFALVAFILYLALGSWRLVAAALTTLVVGLLWTAAFAAAAVGHLNLVSMSVAILFIGLGVDFAIHLGMRYADLHRAGQSSCDAMIGAAEDVGSSLILCTITTATGFYVFVPTPYKGVAELGLIAGTGMVVIVFLTLTLFPALLFSWLAPEEPTAEARQLRFETSLGRSVEAHARAVRWCALALFLAGAAAAPYAHFDPNVVKMRDPGTESVQAFDDLLADTGTSSPWYANAIADDLAQARELAKELAQLEVVGSTLTLDDYVPANQEDKLEVLADIAFLLEAPPAALKRNAEAISTEDQVEALRSLHQFLAADWITEDPSLLGTSMRRLQGHLEQFLQNVADDEDPQPALGRLEQILLSDLPRQLDRLRTALATEGFSRADLPPELVARMLAPDGRARIQAFPRHDLADKFALREFARDVSELVPRASGTALSLVAFEGATKASFVQAMLSAVVMIVLLLLLLWRNIGDTLLVMAPLAMSSTITVAAMAVLDIPFNFVNVIVLPLLLGIGVDSGIHLVHRSRDLVTSAEGLLGTTTARAVFYSAITTMVSFGSLGLSSHRGMASLGMLLSIGMMLTVLCNLVVLPALLALRSTRQIGAD